LADKRYYWLKLQDGFFDSKRIKKLRKLAGGDTYTIIYLKMQLVAMKKGGILEYTGLEKTFAEELALELDEEPGNVGVTVNYLLSCGLLEETSQSEYFVPYAVMNTGSEGTSTKRVREHRERKALQCNADVTPMKQLCNVEIEKEIEKEEDKDNTLLPGAETPPAPPKQKKPSSPVVISIILNDKTEYGITEADILAWKELYPAVDIMQELRKMKGWSEANPKKRKTKNGIKRFINSWLAGEQDKNHGPQGGGQNGGNPQHPRNQYGTCI
jgi:predicted phage replisome organizer